MDRAQAEDDPSHKQIIPYALFRHNGKFINYMRSKSGGESRLHAKRSMGIGGHINPVDEKEDPLGKVHLGVVHLFDLNSDAVTSNEDAIADLQFNTIEELQGDLRERLESWSQFCADILPTL